MRIEALRTFVAVVLLTALLCPRLATANNITLSVPSRKASEYSSRGHISQWETHKVESLKRPEGLTYREIQNFLREEGGNESLPVECCPTFEEYTQPLGGKNRKDAYVELFRDEVNNQSFYEYSCIPAVLNQPCRFIDRKLVNQSRCVQRFSYTYALVRESRSKPDYKGVPREEHRHRHGRTSERLPDLSTITSPGTGWSLDYIKVRSGCSCELVPKQKKKKVIAPSQRPKQTKNKKKTKTKVAKERSTGVIRLG